MLNVAVQGHTAVSYITASAWVTELWKDAEFDNLREINSISRLSSSDSISSMSSGSEKTKVSPVDNNKKEEWDCVRLAARLVM